MDPGGRQEVLELARDLARNKGISLLFSSHLLPDVEFVCEYVLVLAGGRLLVDGRIEDLKRVHEQAFEVRVKAELTSYATRLTSLGCATKLHDDLVRVSLPAGGTPQLLWQAAADEGTQIRFLRPQRSTLEEVFLSAVEQA
jgi:ABC-2 type transport system ATP-binding protein